jgi:hypothetical protein
MQYQFTLKRRFKKEIVINIIAEDEQFAYVNININYPKHKVINCKLNPLIKSI